MLMTDLERIAREFYQQVSSGDYRAVEALLTDDVTWTVPGPPCVPYAGTFHGREGVGEFFRILALCEDLQSFCADTFIVDVEREKICVLGSETAVALPTGRPFAARWAEVFHFRDGQISAFEEHIDTFTLATAYAVGDSSEI